MGNSKPSKSTFDWNCSQRKISTVTLSLRLSVGAFGFDRWKWHWTEGLSLSDEFQSIQLCCSVDYRARLKISRFRWSKQGLSFSARQNIYLSLPSLFQGKEALGFEKILDVFYLWLDPEERRKSKRSFLVLHWRLNGFIRRELSDQRSSIAIIHFVQDIREVLAGNSRWRTTWQDQTRPVAWSLTDWQDQTIAREILFRSEPSQYVLKRWSPTSDHWFDSISEIVLSTAHKAKGLEFPIVILADDFLPRSGDSPLEQLSLDDHRENLNILYVAVTRATKELVLNLDLFNLCYKMSRVRT